MFKTMIRAMIFDLDGTILNTLDDIGNACNNALRHFGYPEHELKAYEQMVGNGFTVLVMRALPEGLAERLPARDFEAIQAYARAYYAEHMCEYTKPYDGLPDVFARLTEWNILCGVLSNKPEPMTQGLIAHYYPNIPFARVYGGREDMPLKPDPTRLLSMVREMGCEPGDCLYIGDSNVDMMTAHAASMTAIGVAWGFRGAKELKNYGAEMLLEEPREILDLVSPVRRDMPGRS